MDYLHLKLLTYRLANVSAVCHLHSLIGLIRAMTWYLFSERSRATAHCAFIWCYDLYCHRHQAGPSGHSRAGNERSFLPANYSASVYSSFASWTALPRFSLFIEQMNCCRWGLKKASMFSFVCWRLSCESARLCYQCSNSCSYSLVLQNCWPQFQ